jgi:hypothetical protein
MDQWKVSYHPCKLRDAGLVREGKWGFYSLDRGAAQSLLAEAGRHLCSVEQAFRAPREQ